MNRAGTLCTALYLLQLSGLGRSDKFSVSSEKNRIIDSFGRERFFHGTNVVFKTDPFIPITTHFDAR